MKKVSKKKLVTTRADDTVAPKWFQPAMQQVLKNYPTKDDLDHILEEKLKNYPTKDDLDKRLSGFATKDDLDKRLSGFATKNDLDNRLSGLETKFATKDDLKHMSEHLTKLFLDRFDEILRRFDEQDRKFFLRTENGAKTLGDHEARITKLESKFA